MWHEYKGVEADDRLLLARKIMAGIQQMDQVRSDTFENNRPCIKYINDFLKKISNLIKTMEIFSCHSIRECFYQEISEAQRIEEQIVLLEVKKNSTRNAPSPENACFDSNLEEYYQLRLSLKELKEKLLSSFQDRTLIQLIDLPIKPGYSYFNLPISSKNSEYPQWILTLVYREENGALFEDEMIIELMHHLSHQIGLAWDKFSE